MSIGVHLLFQDQITFRTVLLSTYHSTIVDNYLCWYYFNRCRVGFLSMQATSVILIILICLLYWLIRISTFLLLLSTHWVVRFFRVCNVKIEWRLLWMQRTLLYIFFIDCVYDVFIIARCIFGWFLNLSLLRRCTHYWLPQNMYILGCLWVYFLF